MSEQVYEREHAEHGPSSLLYKSKCPGYTSDNSGDKTAATEGELGHLAFEKNDVSVIPEDLERLREAAAMCIELKVKILASFEKETIALQEAKVDVIPEVFGYIDCFITDGKTGALLDPKFTWSVGAYKADSPQFKAYVVGLFNLFPTVESITVYVLMPYLGEVDKHTFKRSELGQLTAETVAVVESAKRADPETFRTGEYCAWCWRKSVCPKLHTLGKTLSFGYHSEGEELTLPDEYDPMNITEPEMMAKALILAPIMEKFASNAKMRALQMRLDEGIEIPGYELREKKAAFSVTNAQNCWEIVKEKLTPEEFAACAKVQIGELETQWKKYAPKGQKARSAEELREKLIEADAGRSEGTVRYLKRVKDQPALTE